MLQRHIEVRANVAPGRNHVEKFVSNALRLDIHEAKPGIGKLVGESGEQRCRVRGLLKVLAPSARILRDERYLANSCSNALRDRLAHMHERKAMVAPSNIRDGAKRAEPIATVRDFDICGRRCRPWRNALIESPFGSRIAQQIGEHGNNIVFFAARNERLGLTQLRCQIFPVASGHASGNDELRVALDEIRQSANLENRLEALFRCRLYKRAGIHDHNISRSSIIAGRIACS